VVFGKMLGAAIIALGQGLVMLAIAPLPFIGVKLTWLVVAKLLPLMVLVSLSLSGLGIVLASRMRSQQGFQMVMQVLVMPLTFSQAQCSP